MLAYPHGRENAAVRTAVARAGYLAACGSTAGLNDPAVSPYALRRSEIRGSDSMIGFALLPWLGRARLLPRRPLWRFPCPI